MTGRADKEACEEAGASVGAHMRRLVVDARTEGGGPVREAAAIGAGAFIGCTPFYGFHLVICLAAGWMFGLNRLKLYLAANISNPFMAPWLLLGELQAGAWLRRGEWHALNLETARTVDPWMFGGDLLLGSLVIGVVLGSAMGLATWVSTRRTGDPLFEVLARHAADRYVTTSITAWEFARGKLRADPLYRAILRGGVLPSGDTLIEIGCGQGLMLALLVEAAEAYRIGEWPASTPPPPCFRTLVGVETRPRVASLARRALGEEATILERDARQHAPARCSAVLCLDVLHMMPLEDQERLLARHADALEPGGVILVREADASAGWRYVAVSAGNRLKALIHGNWKQTFHFRTAAEWSVLFERLAFRVARVDTGGGTPFGNVLFVLTDRRRPPAHLD